MNAACALPVARCGDGVGASPATLVARSVAAGDKLRGSERGEGIFHEDAIIDGACQNIVRRALTAPVGRRCSNSVRDLRCVIVPERSD
jgi:hypothetical protein